MPNLCDLLCAPLRGAPVEGPALLYHKVHGTHSLLNGCVHIWPVTEHQIYIV